MDVRAACLVHSQYPALRILYKVLENSPSAGLYSSHRLFVSP